MKIEVNDKPILNSYLLAHDTSKSSKNQDFSSVKLKAAQRRMRTEGCTHPDFFSIAAKKDEFNLVLDKFENNNQDTPALLLAIQANDEQAVQMMLERGVDPNTRIPTPKDHYYFVDTMPLNAVEYAAAYSTPSMLKLLESFGADLRTISIPVPGPCLENEIIQSPMALALTRDNVEVVRFLVSRGIKTDEWITSYPCGLPVFIACNNGSINTLKYLIASGAEIEKFKDELLLYHAEGSMIRFLIKNFDFSQETLDLEFPDICSSGDYELMQVFLDLGADVQRGFELFRYESHIEYEFVEFLLAHGADPKRSCFNVSLLYLAVACGDLKIIQLLVKYGAEINPQSGPNALHGQNIFYYPDVVRFLIDSGIDVNNAYGICHSTPIFYANDPAMIDLLISAGADVQAVDDNGMTPLHIACCLYKNDACCILKLIERGADVNAVDNRGLKPSDYLPRNANFLLKKSR